MSIFSFKYRDAGLPILYTAAPIAPANKKITCSCDKYQQACITITVLQIKVNKSDILAQNRDISDINSVTLKLLGLDVQQLSTSLNTNTESDFITANFSYAECEGDEQFHVNVTLIIIDKCGQQSYPVAIKCEPCETKGINN